MVICEVDTPIIVAITQMLWSLGRRTDKQRLALRTKPELQEEIMSLTGFGHNLYLRAIMATKYGRRFIIISFYSCLYHVILLSTCCPIFFVL